MLTASTAAAFQYRAPITLSAQQLDFSWATKGRIVRLTDGRLVAVYIDAVDTAPEKKVYDFFTDSERPARDVFVRSCDTSRRNCNDALNWSTPLNISNTATRSSINTDWNGNGSRSPYYGDSEKPTIFSSGRHVVITWVDKYCPGSNGAATPQRSVTYSDRQNREIAMSCVYAAHNSGDLSGAWSVNQLSDGSRDAKNDANRGLSTGAWIITWQEDPRGLQPGEGDGPGEGGSGAKVSQATDIWYTYTTNVAGGDGNVGVWKTPVRLTDNRTGLGAKGQLDPIRDADGNPVPAAEIDDGTAGASRANAMLVGGSSPPTAVVAYEETKSSGGLDAGKFVRYHAFPFNAPPTDAAGRAGCVISSPGENARRVRFVTQTKAGASGLRWSIFWRQGSFTQGGPADIVLRYGMSGFASGNLVPAVDPGCQTSDYVTAAALDNAAPLNITSNTPAATTGDLAAATSALPDENARAHRAVMRGDDLFVGYTYSPSDPNPGAGSASYNFYLRRFNAATDEWDNPENLSNLTDPTLSVREPRLVGTPGSGPGCADPAMPVNSVDCQNPDVVFAAWTTTRIDPQLDTSQDLDILITRSSDSAKSFAPPLILAGGDVAQGEAQLRPTPDGNRLFAVWNATDADGSNIRFVSGNGYEASAGCAVNPRSGFDPVLPLLLLSGVTYAGLRRRNDRKSDRPQ